MTRTEEEEELELQAAAAKLAKEDAIEVAARKLCLKVEHEGKTVDKKSEGLHYVVNGKPRRAAPAGETFIKVRKRKFPRPTVSSAKLEEIKMQSSWHSSLSLLKKKKTAEVARQVAGAALTIIQQANENGEAYHILETTSRALAEALTSTHPATLMIDHELARHLHERGQEKEALQILSRVSAVRVNTLGESHPLALSTREELCDMLKRKEEIIKKKEQQQYFLMQETEKEESEIDEDAAAWELARAAILVEQKQRQQISMHAKLREDDHPSPLTHRAFSKNVSYTTHSSPLRPTRKLFNNDLGNLDDPLERAERDLIQARYIISQMTFRDQETFHNSLSSSIHRLPWQIPRPTVFDPPKSSETTKKNRRRYRRL